MASLYEVVRSSARLVSKSTPRKTDLTLQLTTESVLSLKTKMEDSELYFSSWCSCLQQPPAHAVFMTTLKKTNMCKDIMIPAPRPYATLKTPSNKTPALARSLILCPKKNIHIRKDTHPYRHPHTLYETPRNDRLPIEATSALGRSIFRTAYVIALRRQPARPCCHLPEV